MTSPRPLTLSLREQLGLPAVAQRPYKWGFATLVVCISCVPLALAHLWSACIGAALIGLVALPVARHLEDRDRMRREDVYRFGKEAVGRVLDVEPAGPGRGDHIVRVEFHADATLVRTSVVGSPLARRGLAPDDQVLIVYAPDRPTRCLVVAKTHPAIVDAVFED